MRDELIKFAQKMYDDHLPIRDVQILTVNPFEYIIVLKDQGGAEDKYWVTTTSSNPEDWTWLRMIDEPKPAGSA